MNTLHLPDGVPIECYDNFSEMHKLIGNALLEEKGRWTTILGIRNAKLDHLWVRKGVSSKFYLCNTEKSCISSPRLIVSAALKANSIYDQYSSEDFYEVSLSSLMSTIGRRLFQTRTGDSGIFTLFNPMYGMMRFLTSTAETFDSKHRYLDENMEFIYGILNVLANLHGSLNFYSPGVGSI